MNNTTSKQTSLDRIKIVISGYLMDISKGHGTASGDWEFPNQEKFDADLTKELRAIEQKHEDLPHGLKVTQYGFDDYNHPTIDRVNTDKYAIRFMRTRYTKRGDWIHEPQPSSRTKMFFSRTQMSLQEAFDQYPKAISSLTNTKTKDATDIGVGTKEQNV